MLQITDKHVTILSYFDDNNDEYFFEIVETNDILDGEPVWDIYIFSEKLRAIRFPVFSVSKERCSFAELLTMIENDADDSIEYCHFQYQMLEDGLEEHRKTVNEEK